MGARATVEKGDIAYWSQGNVGYHPGAGVCAALA
jgi:hypothetical protein